MADMIFVIPKNDLEAVTIGDLLRAHGFEEGHNLFTTSQAWGASWAGLEPEIQDALQNAAETHVYGVELQGSMPGVYNVDHHKYWNEDRSNSFSSLEQVADLIGVSLNQWQKLVAANDRGYIPAMIEAGATETEITEIRRLERKAQGITAEQEAQAAEALERKVVTEAGTIVVTMPHSKCAPVTDILFGTYENLLIVSPDELNFFGESEKVQKLHSQFGGWAGAGFWGSSDTTIKDQVLAAVEG